MAKRKPKESKPSAAVEEEEDDFEFIPPTFKEDEFYKREIRNAKFSLVVLALAAIGGVIGFTALYFGGLIAGFAIGLLAGFGIAGVPKLLGFEYADFKWSVYFWNSASYVAWIMAFLLVVSNPPFMDLTAPSITDAEWSLDGQEWYRATAPIYIGNNTTQTIHLRIRAVDNADRHLNVTITVGLSSEAAMSPQKDGYTFNHTCDLRVGTYEIMITTQDPGSDTWFGGDGTRSTTVSFDIEVLPGKAP